MHGIEDRPVPSDPLETSVPVAGSTIDVVVADDHAIMREGLRLLLSAQDDVRVVAEADDLDAVRRTIAAHRPQVAVLDLNLRSGSSLALLPELRETSPGTVIVVLTMEDDIATAREVLRAGASAYVLKEAAGQELVRAMRAALAGRTYVDPSLGASLVAVDPTQDNVDGLSPREVDVLRLIALGHTNKEIAGTLHLSVRTIDAHRAHVQQKLGRATRAELVRYAIDRRLLDV